MRRPVAWALLLTALVLSAGCRQPESGGMTAVETPRDWAANLQAWREARDRSFKSSPDSPIPQEDRAAFDGLDYWPDDSGLYFVGRMEPYSDPERMTMISTTGEPRPCARVGQFRFEVGGQPQALQVYRMLDSPEATGLEAFFVPFMDGTTGEESYPAGRYINLEGQLNGPYVLDFNKAYNPYCAYGAPFSCPKTPDENRLSVRIEAGERGYVSEAG